MVRNYSIGLRITIIISLLALVIISLLATIVLTAGSVKDSGIAEAQQVMLEGEQGKIKLGTHTIAQALGKALAGIDDDAEQAKIIGNYINDIRFEADKSGYYFVYRGTVVFVHPVQPKLVGSDLGQTKDANGVYYVSELNKVAQRGGGFVSFIFGKPQAGDGVANAPKLAYAEKIPGTDLWISTGIYIDNVDAYKADMEKRSSDAMFWRMAEIIGLVLAMGVFVLLPLCVFTVRSISLPLRETTLAAEQIASGNLEVHLEAAGRDEVTTLQKSLLKMAQNLQTSFANAQAKEAEALAQAAEARKAVTLAEDAMHKADAAKVEILKAAARLEEAAHGVEATANSISKSTSGVKNGTELQDSRIRDILVAMEQLSGSVLEVSRSASTAAQNSEESRLKVEAGVRLAEESGGAMQELHTLTEQLTQNIHKLGEQSDSIGKIMNVINDIADQTNLLALNAAIEAARAGEAGRGFAVVADEVRKLAEKTMVATHEVRGAITAIQDLAKMNITGMDEAVNSIRRVNQLSTDTVAALTQVQDTAKEAAAEVQSIAAAVDEQSSSSSHVAELISEVSTIASENSSLVSTADAELRVLASEAGKLLDLVSELREAESDSE